MNDASTQPASPAVRASDAEREQTVAVLRRNFTDGRLTQAELEERAGAAYAAQTRVQLRDLTADLPAAQTRPARPGMILDQRLLIILLCVHPPAALVYWLLCRCKGARTGRQAETLAEGQAASPRGLDASPGHASPSTSRDQPLTF
jgi:hypothetical protein